MLCDSQQLPRSRGYQNASRRIATDLRWSVSISVGQPQSVFQESVLCVGCLHMYRRILDRRLRRSRCRIVD